MTGSSLAQTIQDGSSILIQISAEIGKSTCSPVALSKLYRTSYISNLPTLSTTLFLNSAFGPISKLDIDIKTPLPEPDCLGVDFLPAKLVFDSDLAAVSPRTGLLRNSAKLRPAENVLIQIGLIDANGEFVPLDLNQPQALNKLLAQQGPALGASNNFTLGVRYVASRALLSQNTSANSGSQDVTAGNVSVFLPFLLKLN